MKKFVIFFWIVLFLMALGKCGSDERSEPNRCQVCGKKISFSWSGLCSGCERLADQGWFDY